MNSIIETERLRLRHFTLTDSHFIIELVNSPGWLRFIGDRNIHTEEQAEEYLARGPMQSYKEHGFGLSLVELRTSKLPIGMCGLLQRAELEGPDIGFAFLPQYCGRGFAFEMALATLVHAKNILNFDAVFAVTLPENKKSINVLERIGMTFTKTVQFPPNNIQLQLYSSNGKVT